jgi:coenzyme F420-0:L-glutamate ligase/coenzyme F420-1:gamma-L-glutamate ligase
LEDSDILVVTQKIVSKAEGRLVNLTTVSPSKEAIELAKRSEKDSRLVELILRESKEVMRVRPGMIIVEHRLGFVCANAGIDHSNVRGECGNPEDWMLLLPEDPDRTALEIRRKIKIATGNRIGVMIIDSHGRAWRLGTIGTVIGISGLPGLVDERGWQDLFGYRLKVTIVAAADELAAAAALVMGEAAEGIPAVHVRGFPYPLRESSLREMIRLKENDLFR